MTAFELLYKFGRFSFLLLIFSVFLYLRGLYLNCPRTEKDGSSAGSGGEERLTQNAEGIIKGLAQPLEAQVFKSFNRTDSAHNPHRKRVICSP